MTMAFNALSIVILLFMILPWIIGFAWMMPDANRHGQPGLVWAVLTVPLSWLAILVYLVVRALQQPRASI